MRNHIHTLREQVEALGEERARYKNDYTVLKLQTEQKISELENQIQNLTEQNENQAQAIARLATGQPPPEPKLLPETELALKHLFDIAGPVNAAALVFHFDEMTDNKALFHLGVLSERNLISLYTSDKDEMRTMYVMTQKGREYIMTRFY